MSVIGLFLKIITNCESCLHGGQRFSEGLHWWAIQFHSWCYFKNLSTCLKWCVYRYDYHISLYIFSHLLRIYYLVNIRILQLALYTYLTIEARTGRNKVAVATLLVHSVKMAIKRHRMITMAQGGILCRGVNWFPIHLDRPDSWDTK